MQVGRAHLTVMKRCHCLTNNLCLYCGEAGHMAAACHVKNRRSPFRGQNTVTITNTLLSSGGRAVFSALLQPGGATHRV